MAVPKRRKSKSRTRTRRSHDHLVAKHMVECSNCGEMRLPHRVCLNCGYYGDREVMTVKIK